MARPAVRSALVLLALLAAGPAAGQSILTVAGGGSDDGRPPALAALRVPFGACAGPSGTVVVVDSYDHRVRLLDPSAGTLRDVAGNGTSSYSGDGGPATAAGLSEPSACALDANGTLFVADTHNDLVRAVDLSTGTIRTVAGLVGAPGPGYSGDGGPATAARLARPSGLAVAPDGALLVADTGNQCVRRVSAAGRIDAVAGTCGVAGLSGDGGPATQAAMRGPWGLAFDAAGRLLVADSGNHLLRRVDLSTGRIERVAGTGSPGAGGDGGPPAAASLDTPRSLAVDPEGRLLVADTGNNEVRLIGPATISTLAGSGVTGFAGDGGPATAAWLNAPSGVAAAGGAVWVADTFNNRLRRVGADGTITTAAGVGTRGLVGDGGPATAAGLAFPSGLAGDGAGGFLVADSYNHRIRRVDATGLISTVAGSGSPGMGASGEAATQAALSYPRGVALAPSGDLYVADTLNHRVCAVRSATGKLETVAGTGGSPGYSGDGGPATAATLRAPWAVALDGAGGLLVSDQGNHAVRRVDLALGSIATIAGTGTAGDQGDGGPATAARLSSPAGLTVSARGEVLVADQGNHAVRKIAAGTITTVAGNRHRAYTGDGGPAIEASIGFPTGVALSAAGDLLVADTDNARVRRVDAATGVITSVAGGRSGYLGDGGPALGAGLTQPAAVWVLSSGAVLVADTGNNRVRAIPECGPVATPALAEPADGAAVAGPGVTLRWTAAGRAFLYDVLLEAADGAATTAPTRVVASDLAGTSLTLASPAAGTTFTWRVVAKGDPFCTPRQSASSAASTFTTGRGCPPPSAPVPVSPADGVEAAAAPLVLTWQPSPDAASYDVAWGTASPPPVVATGVTGTSFTVPAPVAGSAYWWSVTARAACDASRSTPSAVRTVRIAGPCAVPTGPALVSPAAGATSVAAATTLAWSAVPGASGYDVFLGTASPPPLLRSGVTTTSLAVSGLAAGATCSWSVTARSGCAPDGASSPVQRFTVAGTCVTPGAPELLFVPQRVVAGASYVVVWSEAQGLDAGGTYLVERSADPSFATLLDGQESPVTSASFAARGSGALYHRVRALPGCDPARAGPASAARAATVVATPPDVVFTVQPRAAVTALGEKVEEKASAFVLENLAPEAVTVQLVQQFLPNAGGDPTAFFTLRDPLGGPVSSVRLEPRTPRALEVRFQGVPADLERSYQGVVVVLRADYQPLPVAPYAYVNLKVGGGGTASPVFLAGGVPSEYAFFPGASGDGSGRTIEVEVKNPGPEPMALGAEVGPELWLVPETGWNATPIPPGGTRTLRLTTDRTRAPAGSALPRYTYLTVRTRSGRTARLLVQDSDAPPVARARSEAADTPASSVVVPSVAHATSRIGHTFVTRLRLTNAGTEAVQAELLFTPRDADGFSQDVDRATLLVPPGDVVTLSDPLVQLFGRTPPVSGQLEVRTPASRAGLLTVSSSVDAPADGGGTFGFQMPAVLSGEGARLGSPHALAGVASTPQVRTNLILAETTGRDHAAVRAQLLDGQGRPLGDLLLDVPRFGQRQVSLGDLGAGEALEAGLVLLTVESGGGSVVGVATVIDNTNDDASTFVGRPVQAAVPAARPRGGARTPAWVRGTGTSPLVVPAVVNGYPTFRDSDLPYTFQSSMSFTSTSTSPARFLLAYQDLTSGARLTREVVAPPRSTVAFANVLEQLFGIPPGQRSQGPVFIEADLNGIVSCRVFSVLDAGALGDGFPVVPVPSDWLSGGGSARPLHVDGLEQSLDPARGTRSNLILDEVSGLGPVTAVVRLYEAGNRTVPIAEQELTLAAGEKRQLSTVFAELGLASGSRGKDRTDVLCTVTATSGPGLLSAIVTTIDNRTGDTKNVLLTPSGGARSAGGTGIGR